MLRPRSARWPWNRYLGRNLLIGVRSEMFRHDCRHFHYAVLFGTNHQPDELRHAPRQRCGAPGSPAETESRESRVGLIPNLLGYHATRIRELLHGQQVWRRIVT
jgi:hypothetical protein